MLTFRDVQTGAVMAHNHVTGEIESPWLQEFNRTVDAEIAATNALTKEIRAVRAIVATTASEWTSPMARAAQAVPVCPACEAGEHGQDAYTLAFQCGCRCHQGAL